MKSERNENFSQNLNRQNMKKKFEEIKQKQIYIKNK